MSFKKKLIKLGAALIFQKLYADFKAKKERSDADLAELVEYVDQWKANSPDDLNCVLASILVGVYEGSVDDVEAEVAKAKVEYNAADEDMLPWFESQIENIDYGDEEEAAEE